MAVERVAAFQTRPSPPWLDEMGAPTVSVVIPTLNEAANLAHVLPQLPSWITELVIVDGGSTDGTTAMVSQLAPEARVIVEPTPGKVAALLRGFRAAEGDIIVTLDADGSMDPAEIASFVGPLLSGADFVKGSRFLQGGGSDDLTIVRRTGNGGLRTAVRLLFGGRYSDLCYGYNAFWADVVPLFDGDAPGFEIETYMNIRVMAAGLRVVEVASYERERINGMSHLNAVRDGLRVLRTVVKERRRLQHQRCGRGAQDAFSSRRVIDLPALEAADERLVRMR